MTMKGKFVKRMSRDRKEHKKRPATKICWSVDSIRTGFRLVLGGAHEAAIQPFCTAICTTTTNVFIPTCVIIEVQILPVALYWRLKKKPKKK